MMNFRIIKNALINVLGNAEAGRYQTIGFKRQSTSTDELEKLPMVSVYFNAGDFPKSAGSVRGPVQHDMVFNIEFLVSQPALIDLSVINNPEADSRSKQRAIASLQESGQLADEAMDELFDDVYNVLMDARNIDLGLDVGVAANRWLEGVEKDNPLEKGSLITLSGSARYTCRTQEEVKGDTGFAPSPVVFNNNIEINEDPAQKTAVEIQNS